MGFIDYVPYIICGLIFAAVQLGVYGSLYKPDIVAGEKRTKNLYVAKDMASVYADVMNEQKKKKRTLASKIKVSKQMEDALAIAGIKLSAGEYIIIQGIATLFPVLVSLITNRPIIFTVAVGIIGFVIPPIVVRQKKMKQQQLFEKQLGDALAVITNSLKSGYSFQQAMSAVAKDMAPPISTEFTKVLIEIGYGMPQEDALRRMQARVQSEDLEMLISSIVMSQRVGGNLSQVLSTISKTITERITLKQEINALSAQGRASGVIIGLLPVAVFLFLMLSNPEYVSSMLHTSTGNKMLIVSALMELAGFVAMKKVTDIDC